MLKSICKILLLGILFLVYSSLYAQHSAVFCGGTMYEPIKENSIIIKESGFNTLIMWSMHIRENGALVYNGPVIIDDGQYVGVDYWPQEVKKLWEEPTSINRIEFSIGAWGVPDFDNIQALVEKEGTGPNSILYKNFKVFKEVTGIDVINYDDETNYDVNSTVAFSKMLVDLGYKVTLCPYKNADFWKDVYTQVINYSPGAIDRIYLQCYAGGRRNDPGVWNEHFEGLTVIPGLWSKHGEDCSKGYSPEEVRDKLAEWKKSAGISGGFMWLFNDILKCSGKTGVAEYAKVINEVSGKK
ncbi:lysyl endopeptidase [Bacteroidota bacterium]